MHQGLKTRHVYIHDIIKEKGTSNVARSPIQSKKQGNRISSGGGDWRQQGRWREEGRQNLKGGVAKNIGQVFIK